MNMMIGWIVIALTLSVIEVLWLTGGFAKRAPVMNKKTKRVTRAKVPGDIVRIVGV